MTPNKMAIAIAFWGFAISVFCILALEELFTGHEYPPIWVTFTTEQRGMLNWFGYYPSAVYSSSILLFLAIVIYEIALHTPTAARKAVRKIRSF